MNDLNPALVLSRSDSPDGRQYALYVVPRGGSPIQHPLTDAPVPGTPEDEEKARKAAEAILAERYGMTRDLAAAEFEAAGNIA